MYTATVLSSVKEALKDMPGLDFFTTRDQIVVSDRDDKAPPTIGQKFCIVHPIERFTVSDKTYAYTDRLMFGVTCGERYREVPNDRRGNYLYESNSYTIELLANTVLLYIYNNINNINNNIITLYNNGINSLPSTLSSLYSNLSMVDRIKYLSMDVTPVPRTGEYFDSSEVVINPISQRPSAITLTIRFLAPYLARSETC